jgi:hypothetical protein
VDADGNVWLTTDAGEVQVGSFQAGDADAAMAFFITRFDGLAADVDLLAKRVQTRKVSATDARKALVGLRESVGNPNGIGDYASLTAKLTGIEADIEKLAEQAAAEKAAKRAAAQAAREAIVVEAEGLADTEKFRDGANSFKELLERWKAAPHADRGVEQDLWKRFSKARNRFERRRRAHAAEMAEQREAAEQKKQALVKEAESLADSTEWRETANRFRDLMTEWKAAGRAKRSVDDKLWERFRAAQDKFFSARNADLAKRDSEFAGNLEKKEALLVEAEAILPVSDPDQAREALRRVQERWEAAGHVPRDARTRVEARLKAVEQAVRKAEDDRWRATNPEARARAQSTVDQITASIKSLEKDLAAADAYSKRASELREALAQREAWLTEAQKALTEFGG